MPATEPPVDSRAVRERLVEALRLDLVGPRAGHELDAEHLPGRERPSNWYVAGFLIPTGTPPERSADADEDDDLDTVPESAGLAEESNDYTGSSDAEGTQERTTLDVLMTKYSTLLGSRSGAVPRTSPCWSGSTLGATDRRLPNWPSASRRSCGTTPPASVRRAASSQELYRSTGTPGFLSSG